MSGRGEEGGAGSRTQSGDSGTAGPGGNDRTTDGRDPGRASAARAGTGVETADLGLRGRLRALWGFLVVCWQFLPLAIAYLRDRRRFLVVGRRREVTSTMRRERAEFLLETLVSLGPTYIKLGQLLSTRPDVLPEEYTVVLAQLQDRVPPAPWPEARTVIEDELGPVEDCFEEFDTAAISGASLGQVYTATYEGRRVAVKVLRPGIRRVVEADLRVVTTLMPVVVALSPPGQSFTLENLAEEFASTIREEMDYDHERRNLRTIRSNFADDPGIVVPASVPERSGSRVLTMEYVDGTKITDVEAIERAGIDRSELVYRLERAYIEMIVEHGVFHADPHPGNLAVQDDGTLVFYDFGMVGRIDDHLREQLLRFYVATAREDVDAMIDAFVAMGALDPEADRGLMREVFDLTIENFRGEVDELRIERMVEEFQGQMQDFPLRLPQHLALVVRVSTVLEGVCRTLDEEFDFIQVVTDYVTEEGYGRAGTERVIEAAAERGREFGRALVTTPPRVEDVLDRVDRDRVRLRVPIERGTAFDDIGKRLVYAFVLAAGVVSTAILYLFADLLATGVAAAGSLIALVLLLRVGRGRGGLGVRPQFTRQSMRRRREEG